MRTPWDLACDIPSAHGLAADTMAHICGGPGGYCLSTPEFFLLATDVFLPHEFWAALQAKDAETLECCYSDHYAELMDPYARFPAGECNCWRIGVLAGDMVAAYRALVAIGGEREFICWQDRQNGYRWRRTGQAFDQLLTKIHGKRQPQ